jgi:hypothetical protein
MAGQVVSYDEIQLILPYEIKYLCDLKIVKEINDHGKIYITGVIPDGKKDSCIQNASIKDIIEVKEKDGNVLFKGVITQVDVKTVRDIYYVYIEGVSCTYELDVKKTKKSFQNKDMTYNELIKEVLKNYPGADFIDTAAEGKKTEKFIIQYDETDWEFLKRMASHFNVPLVPDFNNDKPKFWFGIPKGDSKGNLEEYHYSVSKTIGVYRELSENDIKEIEEKEFTYYEIETDKLLFIGDKVQYKNINLVVYKITSEIIKGVLKHLYVLAPEKGLSQKTILNNRVFKASVEGKIIDVEEDKVRIHLEIDDKQNKDEAYWFLYSTFYTSEGSTGWYCMPEINDSVKLYFPTNKEEEGIVINSIRRTKKGDKIDDPNVKYFRTKFKKEKMYDKEQLMISAKDDKVLIRLHEDRGIEIFSDSEVKIKADENIEIGAEEIDMKAADEVTMKCKSSSIKMNGTTHIRGTLVKVRC